MVQVASKLKDEHGGAHIVFVDDGQEMSLPTQERDLFGRHLPTIHKSFMKPAAKAADDADGDQKAEEAATGHQVKLYRCCDEGGTLKVIEVKVGPLHQKDLSSDVSQE